MKIIYMIFLLILEIFNGINFFKTKDIEMKVIFYLTMIEYSIALFIIGACV